MIPPLRSMKIFWVMTYLIKFWLIKDLKFHKGKKFKYEGSLERHMVKKHGAPQDEQAMGKYRARPEEAYRYKVLITVPKQPSKLCYSQGVIGLILA